MRFCMIIIPWLFLLYFYLVTIIWPYFFTNITDKTLDEQTIVPGSFLDKIYLNKSAFPKLRIIALEFVVFFSINIILTAINFILYFVFDLLQVAKFATLIVTGMMFVVGTITTFILEFKK